MHGFDKEPPANKINGSLAVQNIFHSLRIRYQQGNFIPRPGIPESPIWVIYCCRTILKLKKDHILEPSEPSKCELLSNLQNDP